MTAGKKLYRKHKEIIMKANIKLGFAPTRRAIFSAPAAVEYRNLTAARLKELGIDFIDIDDVNDEGLLYDDAGLEKIIEKFQREKVDGLFLPHANFGTSSSSPDRNHAPQ